MLKMEIEEAIKLLKNNNLDENQGLNNDCDTYWDSCLYLHGTGNSEYMPFIMQSMKDWYYSADMIDAVGDLVVGFFHVNAKDAVSKFLNNIDKMYPHAKLGIQFVLTKFIAMAETRNFVYPIFVNISLEKKNIFKEIYTIIVIENPKRAIPEIDEALKSIE
jgi:hypothetical protein